MDTMKRRSGGSGWVQRAGQVDVNEPACPYALSLLSIVV